LLVDLTFAESLQQKLCQNRIWQEMVVICACLGNLLKLLESEGQDLIALIDFHQQG
jgi:hypothetical protein